jgi:hypothetical protein
MKKLTTRLMIATAALVVAAGAASAQTMTAAIPFEFRLGDRVMAPGPYRVELSRPGGAVIFRLSNLHSGESITLLPQAPVDPRREWVGGNGKLAFACTSGSCALAEVWTGSGSHAYSFYGPKSGKDETAHLTVIPMQPSKGE